MVQWVKNLTSIHEDVYSIPGLIQCAKNLSSIPTSYYRPQMQLESGGMAVAVTSSYSSDSAPILGTSICPRCSHKKIKKKILRN